MDTYVNKIMSNHVFDSESSENLYHLYSEKDETQTGGRNNAHRRGGNGTENRPRGGFPPIYIVDKKEKDEEQSKNRQLSSRKTSVSIRDILNSKK